MHINYVQIGPLYTSRGPLLAKHLFCYIIDVDLSTMLRFNKLKKLTNDVSVVAKAVENSPSLQVW